MSDTTIKMATPDHPIHDLLALRWSPYSFDSRPVENDKLISCLEAARWAPSSFNEQPWSFIIAKRQDARSFEALLGCLVEANQAWAQHAGALMITVTRRTFSGNAKPNRVAEHDVGLAVANLTVQASALGLHVHQMAGIDPQKTRYTYRIPDGFDPVTAIALGYVAAPTSVGNDLGQRDQAPRHRKKLSEFVFGREWNQAADLVALN